MTTAVKAITTHEHSPGAQITPDRRGRRAAHPVRLAAADALVLLVGMIPFGVVVGITAASLRITGASALGVSGLLYAGTAQMAGFAQLAAGSAPVAVIATMVIVNARLMLYGVAIADRFRGQPLWFRIFGPMLLIDQTFATATEQGPENARAFRRYWVSLGLTVLAGWTSAIAVGMVFGPRLPTDLPFGAAGTACLIGLLVPRLADRPAIATAAVAGVAGVAGLALPTGTGILLATCCGLLAGRAVTRRTTGKARP